MPLKTLPYFHRIALRQRFADHLAQARDSLDDEEHRWLQGWLQAPGPDAPRIDRLSAITASAHASELTASLLLSRSTHPRVFFYHPLLGLLRFEDRTQLKHHLVELLSSGHPHVLLHYICACKFFVFLIYFIECFFHDDFLISYSDYIISYNFKLVNPFI